MSFSGSSPGATSTGSSFFSGDLAGELQSGGVGVQAGGVGVQAVGVRLLSRVAACSRWGEPGASGLCALAGETSSGSSPAPSRPSISLACERLASGVNWPKVVVAVKEGLLSTE